MSDITPQTAVLETTASSTQQVLPPPRGTALAYRAGIDGLRAVAVIGVFIFHLAPKLLPGGFVGVDVFFVISGFLITQILLRDFEHKGFSIGKFYQRRIARLYPAFFIVSLTTLIGALFIYSAQDLASAGANLTAASLWIINMKLMLQGNYFTISSDAQPFLHYWSLAVEEQFYMLFPITLFILHRIARRHLAAALMFLFAVSLAACVVVTIKRPEQAFYLLPTRAWELLAGGILAIFYARKAISSRKIWNVLSLVGLILVLASYLLIREGLHFPGYIALLPTIGTVLFIGPMKDANGPAERILSWSPAVLIGRMSYSLYLWHWPVFSLVDYQLYDRSAGMRTVLKIVVSFALTVTGFFVIETPGREFLNRPANRKFAFAFLALALALFIPLGLSIRKHNYINAVVSDLAGGGLTFNTGATGGSLVLMGDSEGSMYGKLVKEIAEERNMKLTVISMAAEDPLPHTIGRQNPLWTRCLEIVKSQHPDDLILVCSWTSKLEGDNARLATAVNELRQHTGRLILVDSAPELPPHASRDAIRAGNRPPFYEEPVNRAARLKYNAILKSFEHDNVLVLHSAGPFENPGGDIRVAAPDGRFYFQDASHLAYLGSALLKDEFVRLLSKQMSGDARH
jgi:peptidoglycan/LPS O-acetylase OafA/YrhL